MKCSKCGKEMSHNNSDLMGISLKLNSLAFPKEFLQNQMGKYELDKEYSFCFECFIDSLFQRGC